MTARFLEDLAAHLSNPGVWWNSIVVVALGLMCILIGTAVGRRSGLLSHDSSGLELTGAGLGLGLIVVSAVYATLRSGFASAFTPVLCVFLVATVIGHGSIRVQRPPAATLGRGLAIVTFLVAVGLVYGVTIAPSPRDGVQPIEFMDEAFYAVLSTQLRETGIESVYLPAGFGQLDGLPPRSWYHWGEAWLGALALEVPGVSPMQARHLVVLPLLLLSVVSTIGSVAGRLVGPERRRAASLVAAFGMLTIGPVPLVLGDHFDWWARPIGFTITLYGMAFVATSIGIQIVLTSRQSGVTTSRAIAIGGIAASLVASHILIATTAAIAAAGAAVAWTFAAGMQTGWIGSRHVKRPVIACILAGGATFGWGLVWGHGIGGEGSIVGVEPFAVAWQRSLLLTTLGGGTLCLGILAAILVRRRQPRLFAMAFGVVVAMVAGALAWGLRLAEFNAFHIYFGTVAVLLTPVAVIATVVGAMVARDLGRTGLASIMLLVVLGQGAIGIGSTMQRLYEFGPGHYDPVPLRMLERMRLLPEDAKVAYACAAQEEVAFWDARLISLTAHTGRLVVPMCFQADVIGPQLGLDPDPTIENPFFLRAPQRDLYPSHDAVPSALQVEAFMQANGIRYIFADEDHPNTLVADARPILAIGTVTLLEVP